MSCQSRLAQSRLAQSRLSSPCGGETRQSPRNCQSISGRHFSSGTPPVPAVPPYLEAPRSSPTTFSIRRAGVSAAFASPTCRSHSLRLDGALASNAPRRSAASRAAPRSPGTSTVLGAVQAAPQCPWVRFASRSTWARTVPSQALADLAKPFAKVNLSRNILILVSNKKCPDLDACLEPPICHIGRHPDSPETRHA